jgi:hypothetical protein
MSYILLPLKSAMRRRLLAFLALGATACSASPGSEPLVEYPDPPAGTEPASPASPGPPSPGPKPGDPKPAPEPTPQPGMTKLWDAVTWTLGVTSDGALIATKDKDLVALAPGALQPTMLVTDFDSSADAELVRGKLVGIWLGDDALPSSVTTWSPATGLVKNGPVTYRTMLYPKPATDTFAYRGKASSSLASKLAVTRPGQGDGATILASLDNGVLDRACAPLVTWMADDLLVAGCVDGATKPAVAVYAADGSGKRATVLDGAAPGVWPNRARTRVLVQTTTASSLRGLTASAVPVPLDTRLLRATVSADDAKVLYLRADGKLRRAATSAPVAPVDLGTAIALLGASDDARFAAFATTRDASTERTDLWIVDASATPPTPRKLADGKAVLHGFAKNGQAVAYQTTAGPALTGPLYVTSTTSAGATPVKVSEEAQRVLVDGDVVYFHELVGTTTKTMTLKAVRLASPAAPVVVADNLDPLTTHLAVANGRLLVASKLGLWSYPAVTP